MSEIVKAVRDHAVRNYNKGGWDYVVECYSDEEIEREAHGAKTPREAIRRIGAIVRTINDYRKDIQAEAF